MTITRRSVIKTALAGSAAAAVAAPAISQGRVELRMVTTWPKGFPGLGTGAERLARRIGELTDGKLTVRVSASGELVPPFESFDAVARGTADMVHALPSYWQNKSKAVNFFATVPFGFTAPEMGAWVKHMGGQELWDEVYGNFGLKPFHAGNTGPQMAGWFNKEIKSVDDIKGLKFRMPGLGGEVLSQLGAVIVNVPGGELFQAMQSGTVDGLEWVGPWNDMALGFFKVAKYYYWPGFHEPAPAIECSMNKQKYDSLSKDFKAAIAYACDAECELMLADYNANNGRALNTLVRQHGVQLRQLPRDVILKLSQTSTAVVDNIESSGDALTKKVVGSYKSAASNLRDWTRISEFAFLGARQLS